MAKTYDHINLLWYQKPQDAGQIVETMWLCLGESGVIRRTVDRSDLSTHYYWHKWRARSECRFEPWNGIIDVVDRCKSLSYEDVEKMVNGES